MHFFFPCGRREKEIKVSTSVRTGRCKPHKWLADMIRIHLHKDPYQAKSPSLRMGFLLGGGRWIRTTEGIASRFTVCPLWPLGNSPIFCSPAAALFGGAGGWTRTPDLLITNQLLYRLSYTSITGILATIQPPGYISKKAAVCQPVFLFSLSWSDSALAGRCLTGAGGGTRPSLRRRPPRVAKRPRRFAKTPRVRVPFCHAKGKSPSWGLFPLVPVVGLEPTRGISPTDFESVTSTIPSHRHVRTV